MKKTAASLVVILPNTPPALALLEVPLPPDENVGAGDGTGVVGKGVGPNVVGKLVGAKVVGAAVAPGRVGAAVVGAAVTTSAIPGCLRLKPAAQVVVSPGFAQVGSHNSTPLVLPSPSLSLEQILVQIAAAFLPNEVSALKTSFPNWLAALKDVEPAVIELCPNPTTVVVPTFTRSALGT